MSARDRNRKGPADLHPHADHHQGLARHLDRLRAAALDRRTLLRWALGASLLPLLGCGSSEADGGADASSAADDSGSSVDGGTQLSCVKLPEETAGPYPGDGSNGPNILTQSGIVRSDIRSSTGAATGTAAGIPLTITLSLVSSTGGCAPLAGLAVYLWHCDRAGLYSMYSAGATDQNYLRGVQATDASGNLTFTTIFPGCYAGRWPHVHFETYPSLASATTVASKLATSQLALPRAACDAVYATTGYQASVGNLAQLSLASDNVFSDGSAQQLATVTGDAATGYAATLLVPIAR